MKCPFCGKDVLEFSMGTVDGGKVVFFEGGEIEKLNSGYIIIACGYGSKYDCDAFVAKTESAYKIFEANIGKHVCDDCLKSRTKMKDFKRVEDAYAMTKETWDKALNEKIK